MNVSIVTVNLGKNLPILERLLLSLRTHTEGEFEMILVTNEMDRAPKGAYDELAYRFPFIYRVVSTTERRGFAVNCNDGARYARGQYLLFLNDDTEATPGWLPALLRGFQVPDVGIVGARCLYPGGRVQHCGITFVAASGRCLTRHVYRRYRGDHRLVMVPRYHQAVTGACLLIRRKEFEVLGGFDERYELGFEDIDLAFRYRRQFPGGKVLYTPYAQIVHHEGATRGRKDRLLYANEERFLETFREQIVADGDAYLRMGYKRIGAQWEGVLRQDGRQDNDDC